MHNRVPGLRSGGLMRCLITSALALLLSGCAILGSWAWPWERDAAPPALPLPSLSNHLQMISAILDGDAERRQQLWFIHGPREQPAHERLYKAVLRSVPGHPGHNPVLADQQLQQIAADPEHPDLALLARIRLHGLREVGAAGAEVRTLKQRLERIVEIERAMGGKPREP